MTLMVSIMLSNLHGKLAFNNSCRDTPKPPLPKISDEIPLVSTFHPFNYIDRHVISSLFLH